MILYHVLLIILILNMATAWMEDHNDDVNHLDTDIRSRIQIRPDEARFKRRKYANRLTRDYKYGFKTLQVDTSGTGSDGGMTGQEYDVTESVETSLSNECIDIDHPDRESKLCRRGCCHPHYGGGCHDDKVSLAVCSIDPFCCSTEWDYKCVKEVLNQKIGLCQSEDAEILSSVIQSGLPVIN